MKNKVFKLLITLLVIIFITCIFSQPLFAFQIGNMFSNTGDKSDASQHVANIFGTVINILQIVGAGIALIMLIYIGVRLIYESPSGKAKLAKTFRYYILGAIILFAAVGILEIIKKFSIKNVNNW